MQGGALAIDFGQSMPDGLIQRGASLDYYRQSVDPKTREMGNGNRESEGNKRGGE